MRARPPKPHVVPKRSTSMPKLTYDRSKSLKDQKFLSQAAVDKAQGRSRCRLGQSLGSRRQPEPRQYSWRRSAASIARRHAELGDMATPGKPLFTIYEPGGLRVTASIPQYRLKEMRNVTTARVEFPELGKWVDGDRRQAVLPTADAATHVSQVRVSLPPVPEATPGMFARVHFVLGQASKMTVPASAVVRRGEVAAVYVISADQRTSLRQLRLGEAVGVGEIEVLAGLASGDKVVTEPVKAGHATEVGQVSDEQQQRPARAFPGALPPLFRHRG
jgi:hypothetical protein